MYRRFSKLSVLLICGNFLVYFTNYMVIPFLSLFLKNSLGFEESFIGILVGIAPLASCCLGYWGGKISEKMGLAKSVIVGLFVSSACYFCYSFIRGSMGLIFIGVLLGISGSLIAPAIKALMSLTCDDKSGAIFRLRYITICLGAILGPIVGLVISLEHKELLFISVSLLRLLYGVTLLLLKDKFPKIANDDGNHDDDSIDLSSLKDGRLLLYTAGGLLLFLGFSQFEWLLPLAINCSIENPEEVFSALLIINASLGVIFQVVISLKKPKIFNEAIFGNAFFAIAFIIFAIFTSHFYALIVATVIFTVGEVFAIPAGEILIDNIAPKEKKASYFGIAESRQLGFFAGPAIGGYILENFGAFSMFFFAFFVTTISSLCYFLGMQICKQKLVQIDGNV